MLKTDIEAFLLKNNLKLKINSYGLTPNGYYHYYIENAQGNSLCCIAIYQYDRNKWRTIGRTIKKLELDKINLKNYMKEQDKAKQLAYKTQHIKKAGFSCGQW